MPGTISYSLAASLRPRSLQPPVLLSLRSLSSAFAVYVTPWMVTCVWFWLRWQLLFRPQASQALSSSLFVAVVKKATITEISDGTDVDLRKGRDEEVLEMLMANPKVRCTCDCCPVAGAFGSLGFRTPMLSSFASVPALALCVRCTAASTMRNVSRVRCPTSYGLLSPLQLAPENWCTNPGTRHPCPVLCRPAHS